MGALGPFKGVLKLAFFLVGNGHPQLGISCLDLHWVHRVPWGKKRQLSHQAPHFLHPYAVQKELNSEKRQRKYDHGDPWGPSPELVGAASPGSSSCSQFEMKELFLI